MRQKGKGTKTEIFCLLLTAAFVVILVAVRLLGGGGGGGYTVTTQHPGPTELPQVERINVNTADEAELQRLPGIGAMLAQRIVDHREANGPFAAVEELLQVEGIGPSTLEELREMVTTG